MYYPIGLPKRLKVPTGDGIIRSIVCNRDRNLFCILSDRAIWIWYNRPCIPLCGVRRSAQCLEQFGTNVMMEWRPDSSLLVVATTGSKLLFYRIHVDDKLREVYLQNDSPTPGLRRYSAELYTKEKIPPLFIKQEKCVDVRGGISCLVCLRDELMVGCGGGNIQRLRWDGSLHYDYCIDLARVPFCDDQLVMQALPLTTPGVFVVCLEYSPLVGGFATVLSDGRAAFLTASTLQFDPNAVQGIWARELDDATCAAINHKYRLLAYGRASGEGVVYQVDEATGGLEVTHKLALSPRDYSGDPGPVGVLKWSPDGTVLALCWTRGGLSLWSVFGSLLTTSLKWDYSEDPRSRPIAISSLEWGAEGYEAWCVQTAQQRKTPPPRVGGLMLATGAPPLPGASSADHHQEQLTDGTPDAGDELSSGVLQFNFVKSALTVNPSMSGVQRVLLQGSDRIYLSTPEELPYSSSYRGGSSEGTYGDETFPSDLLYPDDEEEEVGGSSPEGRNDHYYLENEHNAFAGCNKQWLVVPIPYSYTAANYPIRYVCASPDCSVVGVAGRNGAAHYSLKSRRWHLFGNESQEEDFVVTGGLVWWHSTHLVLGAYNIPANTDELRLYPQHQKLDDQFCTVVKQPAQVLLLNIYSDLLAVLTADCHITVYHLSHPSAGKAKPRVAAVEVRKLAAQGPPAPFRLTVLRPLVVSSKSVMFDTRTFSFGSRGGLGNWKIHRTSDGDESSPDTTDGPRRRVGGGEEGGCAVERVQEVDISGLAVHPACVVAIALTSLRTESPKLPLHHSTAPPHHHHHHSRHRTTSTSSRHSSSLEQQRRSGVHYHHNYAAQGPAGGGHNRPHRRRSSRMSSVRSCDSYATHTAGDLMPPPDKPPPAQSLIFNISGKVLMIQRDQHPAGVVKGHQGTGEIHPEELKENGKLFQQPQMTPIVLASCCESFWCSNSGSASIKPHLSHALWLHCGAQGTRAWLPLFPNTADQSHTFLARRIMLPVMPSIYPLAVLFEEGILLGAETDSSLMGCDSSSLHHPTAIITRTSQVYLQDVLRQLLRRNLGYHAWEVASTCRGLPHFPHALELLLHQVLEEEATSKEPLPDSLLPRVLDFIKEFPVHHLQTVVQCARKTELPLWRFLFSVAGSPGVLFNQALVARQLDTAASYLIILQNLESASVSRSHATRLLDATLEAGKWQLCKDLIRFLGAIDPTDLDSPKPSCNAPSVTSGSASAGPGGGVGGGGGGVGGGGGSTKVGFSHASQSVSPACVDEDLSMILPNTQLLRRPSGVAVQALRSRSYSSASAPKGISPGGSLEMVGASTPPQQHPAQRSTSDPKIGAPDSRKRSFTGGAGGSAKDNSAEEYFVDVILQRHARKLLVGRRLHDLGTMAARLDFPVVSWLRRERCRAARVDDFVAALRQVHMDFSWPYPAVTASSLRQYSVEGLDDSIRELSLTMQKVPSLAQGKIGDSGYLSHSTCAGDTQAALTPQHAPLPPFTAPGCSLYYHRPDTLDITAPRQAVLVPHSPTSGEHMSVMSEECCLSSVYGGDSSSTMGGPPPALLRAHSGDTWAGDDGDPTRDLLARSPDPPLLPSPKPPPHAQVQLRYLLQVFLEAGCLEWSAVVSVVLRDALAVVRVVTAAKDAPLPPITRLVNGLHALTLFTHTHCLGYQNFMAAISPQVRVLESIIKSRHESQCSTSTPTSSSRSVPVSGYLPSKKKLSSCVSDAIDEGGAALAARETTSTVGASEGEGASNSSAATTERLGKSSGGRTSNAKVDRVTEEENEPLRPVQRAGSRSSLHSVAEEGSACVLS